jgi:hypothetical protein
VLALALSLMFFAGPLPDQPLTAVWNVSPVGSGSTLVPAASDPRDGWEVHDIVGRHDWLRFQFIDGAPALLLNTPGKVLTHEFVVTNMTAAPWSVEFTATQTGGTDWGSPLVITVSQP